MFVRNIDSLKHVYSCNTILGKYIEKQGQPVLGKHGKIYYFARTKKLNDILSNLPFHLKLIKEAGERFEK